MNSSVNTSAIVSVASPNIALIKYWGKQASHDDASRNLALNPSLSMTLSKAKTEVRVRALEDDEHQIYVQGKVASPEDRQKILAHLARVEAAVSTKLPPLRIDSSNNFPSGAGIASSASSFAALTCAFLAQALGESAYREFLLKQPELVSSLARRGSGSAARSTDGPYMKWNGNHAHRLPIEWKLRDTILIFSSAKKEVSSTDGHRAAVSSPDFTGRLERLPARLQLIEKALTDRDLRSLGPLIEEEALEMHAIARGGTPRIDYLLPQTKAFVAELAQIKDRSFFFTIDAGPNLHLISEVPIAHEIQSILDRLGLEAEIWEDHSGGAPTTVFESMVGYSRR